MKQGSFNCCGFKDQKRGGLNHVTVNLPEPEL